MTEYQQLAQQMEREGIPVREQEPLSRHTTFHIGGPAALFCQPRTQQELVRALALCREAGVRSYLLGNGSNTLFADEGYDGVVIRLGRGLDQISADPDGVLTAGCGAGLSAVCRFAAERGLAGLEFAYGIPGSVGGAVYMNAGAYGGEMKDVLQAVDGLDEKGNPRRFLREELDLAYRTSRFEQKGGTVLSAQFALHPAPREEIVDRMEDYLARRTAKQPLDKPSAGSTFKRPKNGYAAALIEQCGLKGFRIGGAAVSEKHSGFVVNLGGATARDVLAVADEVARVVEEKTGIHLEKEIRVVR